MTGHETTLSIDTVLDAVFESCAGQAVPQVERTLCDLTAQAHPPVDARMVRTFAEAISAGRRVCIRWRRGQAVWTIDRSETLSRHGGPHGTSDTCPSVDL